VASYQPGQSIRFSVVLDVLGILTNPPALTFTLRSPDGTLIVDPAPANDSTGHYHSDQVIPVNGKPGKWAYRWRSSGSQAAQNANVDKIIEVAALDFP
jgi:hypothetical protein